MLLIDKFNNKTLSKTDWTHDVHLTVAIWYIYNFDFFDAVCRIKAGIVLLNHSHETENTSKAGYHETLTIFWSKIIQTYITSNKALPMEQLVNGFLNSSLAERNLPFEFYEKERLLDPELRTIYSEPSKKEINQLTVNEILNT